MVSGLEATRWAACLDSLCGRLRANTPVVDAYRGGTAGDRLPVVGESVVSPESAANTAGQEATVAPLRSWYESPEKSKRSHREHCLEDELPTKPAADRQGPAFSYAAGDTADTVQRAPPWVGNESHLPTRSDVTAGRDGLYRRGTKALPLVWKRPSWGEVGAEAGQGVWFDKTILKVGARVPWGRLHKGRFAKVRLTTVSSRRMLSSAIMPSQG